MNVGILLAYGSGTRFGSALPKQFHDLGGRMVAEYPLMAFRRSRGLDVIIIIGVGSYCEALARQYGAICTRGGSTRNESIAAALHYIEAKFPQCSRVFIAEAARPFLTANEVDQYLTWLDNYDAVITTQVITDSLGCVTKAAVDRAEYYLIQAPEAFLFEPLHKYFRADSIVTATVQQLPVSCRIKMNFDMRNNIKITYPSDIVVAEALISHFNNVIETQ